MFNRNFMTAAAVLLLASSCSDRERERAKEEASEAIDATTAYAKEKRDQFKAAFNEGMDKLSTSMGELKERIAQEAAERRPDLDAAYAKLSEKKQAIDEKLKELGAAAADKWDDVKVSLERLKLELQEQIDQLKARLK